MDDYLINSSRTMASDFHNEIVPLDLLLSSLNKRLATNAAVDACKKALFYGRDLPPVLEDLKMQAIDGDSFDYVEHPDTIHGVLGIDTEAAEVVEHLVEALIHGTPIDEAQLKNELGDILWYIAVLCRRFGWTFDELADDNIAKLRRRFPVKFESTLAIVRGDDQNSAFFTA